MQSWEVLREAAERIGVKALAGKLRLSTALVYKWCQEVSTSEEPAGSGARNPLDRLKIIVEATGDERVVQWLCQVAHGYFVPNPQVDGRHRDEQFLAATQRVVQDFGELLTRVCQSIENDGKITPGEAEAIRRAWDELKSQGECFVAACEQGLYGGRG
jgi:hypothetical protein